MSVDISTTDVILPVSSRIGVVSTNSVINLVEVDAGHNVAGDNPEALLAEVGGFLAKTE